MTQPVRCFAALEGRNTVLCPRDHLRAATSAGLTATFIMRYVPNGIRADDCKDCATQADIAFAATRVQQVCSGCVISLISGSDLQNENKKQARPGFCTRRIHPRKSGGRDLCTQYPVRSGQPVHGWQHPRNTPDRR